MTMYQRSCDLFLGVPFNITFYALLLHLVAGVTGLRADNSTMFLADAHIYENHLEQVNIQLNREPFCLPVLDLAEASFAAIVDSDGNSIDKVTQAMLQLGRLIPDDINLAFYNYHPAIKAPMAV